MNPLAILFHVVLLLVCVCVCVRISNADANSCGDHTDCQALLKFKGSIQYDPSSSLESWNQLNSVCNWTGITCGNARFPGRVTSLELPNKGLQGSISPFLSNLSRLMILSLEGNKFSGQIPDSIGQLSMLAHVNMSDNKFDGNIPTSLRGCRSLRELDLTINNFSGKIPDELGEVKSLRYLALAVNSLVGSIPKALSNLTELTRLELASNYLTGSIPPEIGLLKKLEIMYFHTNFFEGEIPSSLSNCSALRELSLIKNSLTGRIPTELGTLPNLEKCYLSINRLSGKIPSSVSNISRLILFDVSLNQLEGEAPVELGRLKNLQNLYLHSNNLVSRAGDDSFGLLAALTNCSFLQKLHLGSCFFSGKLPSNIGGLSKDLYYLNLINNRLTGDVPYSIGNLTGLVNLNLGNNRLNGTIPGTLGTLDQLQRLYLGNNRLRGKIPGQIGQMSSLGLLDLGNNSFEGSIPIELGNLSQLRYLYLSMNQLSGIIPTELTRCTFLLMLDLSYNQFGGRIPDEIRAFSELALALNLSNNNLEGEIPVGIGKLVSVQAIDLSMNNLSGAIPSIIGSCVSLDLLNLSGNAFGETIPQSLKQITSLRVLDLSYNDLTGKVPIWIGNATTIKSLNLSYNRLMGEVPNTGQFKYFNRTSFLGNPELCSKSVSTGLSLCREERKHRNNRTWVYVLLAGSVTCGVLVVFFIVFLKRRRRSRDNWESLRKSNATAFELIPHEGRKFTQRELEIATGGFSEDMLLGRGSFGSVYKAIVEDESTTLAVKLLDRDCAQSQKSFKRECQILSTVRHRNLVRMVGSVWNPEFKALVLEFIGNGNLAQHLHDIGCQLTLQERISILLDVAHGLEYLHERCSVQIIHCDLKPPNILLDGKMVAHVADFGIGKIIEEGKTTHGCSTTGFLRGTFGYMPPEYGQGNVSVKGDVYSFGMVLLETMTRRTPTSEEFSDGLNLRKWVCSLYPGNLWEAIDESLKEAESGLKWDSSDPGEYRNCCVQVMKVGVMCTEANPQNRPTMSAVVRLLEDAMKLKEFERDEWIVKKEEL